MTRVDLVTGFLGAGKTTFIRRYLRYLRGGKVRVIENEFGSIGVDARLLRDEDCEIDDLSGVCMCCRGKGQFIEMLADAAAQGCDRVLVEPSGIYDVDEFFSVMDDPAVRDRCEIGSILTIADACVPEDLSEESKALVFSGLMAAGKVVLSKTQLQPPGASARTVAWMNDLIRELGGGRVLGAADVCDKDWDALTDADFAEFQTCGYRRDAHRHAAVNHEEIYESSLVGGCCAGEDDLRERLRALFAEPRFGQVLRAKGHVRDIDRRWYEVNCTRDAASVRPAPDVKRGVLVVIGQDLKDAALQELFLPKG